MDAARWDDLFSDLEAEVSAADAADLRGEVADRTRREHALLRIVDRLRPAIGYQVQVRLAAGGLVSGRLAESGADWLLIDEGATAVLVPLTHLLSVGGLGALSSPPGSEGRVGAALDLRHVLRRLARDRAAVTIGLVDGSSVVGTLDRVGLDFVDVAEHPAGEFRRPGAVRQVRALLLSAITLVRVG